MPWRKIVEVVSINLWEQGITLARQHTFFEGEKRQDHEPPE
jgi:hypothetical protein